MKGLDRWLSEGHDRMPDEDEGTPLPRDEQGRTIVPNAENIRAEIEAMCKRRARAAQRRKQR